MNQLLTDLENLLADLDKGWGRQFRVFGDGGCLIIKMARRFGDGAWNTNWNTTRAESMIAALGFPCATDMMVWNDSQESVEPVKQRVRDAISTLLTQDVEDIIQSSLLPV